MALVQWTSRELLCTIRSHHTDANRISVFIFFSPVQMESYRIKKESQFTAFYIFNFSNQN